MNTKKRTKTVLTLAIVLGIFAVFSGSLQADVLVYEPFGYIPAGALLDGFDGGAGFDGAWIVTEGGADENYFEIKDGGMSFTDTYSKDLSVAGNSVYRTGSGGRSEAHRVISAAAQAALLTDGTTIWFSVLYQKIAGDGRAAFVIGTDTYDVAAGGLLSNFTSGGEGFGFGSSDDRLITAIAYDDSAGLTEVDSTVVASDVKLVAGKIVWNPNGTDDELYLYEVTDLFIEPTTAIATVSADLDQSAFDLVVLQHSYDNTTFDEIRIGATYNDVIDIADPNDPSVNAGDDMITWSDREVQLAPTVINNDVTVPQRTLSYLWSAEPVDGVVFSDETVEAPTVTITKSPFSIFLVNGGFEDPVLADGDWTEGLNGIPSWSQSQNVNFDALGTDVTVFNGAGALNPDTATYGYEAPVGANIGYMGSSNNPKYTCLKQDILTTLQANTEYVLSALVGNPQAYNVSEFNPDGVAPDYQIALLAGDVVVASSSGSAPDDASYWNTASLTFTPDASHAQLGQQLEIWLIGDPLNDATLDPENGTNSGGYELHFDDVTLLIDGESVGYVAKPLTVTLTLAVTLEGKDDPVTNSLVIDVYDDACLAAKAAAVEFDSTDLDADCITGLADFAVMAKTWLVDYELTEPVPKPE